MLNVKKTFNLPKMDFDEGKNAYHKKLVKSGKTKVEI